METGYIVAGQCIYGVTDATKSNNMETKTLILNDNLSASITEDYIAFKDTSDNFTIMGLTIDDLNKINEALNNNSIKRIEALMSENETVKNNAIKIIAVSKNPDRARQMYSTAKIENEAYQNAINIIKEVSNG